MTGVMLLKSNRENSGKPDNIKLRKGANDRDK
jgi:hypothetical protein